MSSPSPLRVVLVGGGNSTHCLAPLILSTPSTHLTILTRRPSLWSPTLTLKNLDRTWCSFTEITVKVHVITSDFECVKNADVIWFAGVPVHNNRELLKLIRPHLEEGRRYFVGSICCYGGFNWIVKECLDGLDVVTFGTNLIPWCCGTV